MKRFCAAFASAVLLVGVGCGLIPLRTEHTINAHIVIEIRQQIEEQADDVLDFIEGTDDALAAPEQESADSMSWLDHAVDFLRPVRPVYAAEMAELDSPRIREIAKTLKQRHPKLQALKKKSVAGEDNQGYVALRNADRFAEPEDKNAAQKLIAAENADRKELYKEIARLNEEHGVTLSMVERIYARKRLERAEPGEIFQLPPKGADFDEFKESKRGKKLGEACVPEAWVTIK